MRCVVRAEQLSVTVLGPDDTPVASAKAKPADGSRDVGEEGNASNGHLWRTVIIGEQEHRIDMQVIRPYLRVITHGGEWRARDHLRTINGSGRCSQSCTGHL